MQLKKLHLSLARKRQASSRGHTLVEVLIGIGVLGIMMVSLYGGLGSGFSMVQVDRENLRATQILAEKMEVIRLFNWTQVNTPGFIPTSFSEPYYVGEATNTGFNYAGTVLVTNAPIGASYSNDLRMVQVSVSWTSGGVAHQRQMTTFVSQYGLQNYVY